MVSGLICHGSCEPRTKQKLVKMLRVFALPSFFYLVYHGLLVRHQLFCLIDAYVRLLRGKRKYISLNGYILLISHDSGLNELFVLEVQQYVITELLIEALDFGTERTCQFSCFPLSIKWTKTSLL